MLSGSAVGLCLPHWWTAARMPKAEKDHTADSVACCVVFLLAPLEDVTQKLLFSIIPK